MSNISQHQSQSFWGSIVECAWGDGKSVAPPTQMIDALADAGCNMDTFPRNGGLIDMAHWIVENSEWYPFSQGDLDGQISLLGAICLVILTAKQSCNGDVDPLFANCPESAQYILSATGGEFLIWLSSLDYEKAAKKLSARQRCVLLSSFIALEWSFLEISVPLKRLTEAKSVIQKMMLLMDIII